MADINNRAGTDTLDEDVGDTVELWFPVLLDGVEMADLSGVTPVLTVTPAVPEWSAPVEVTTADGQRFYTVLDGDVQRTYGAGRWKVSLSIDEPDVTIRHVNVSYK